jgi:hypothetical protein
VVPSQAPASRRYYCESWLSTLERKTSECRRSLTAVGIQMLMAMMMTMMMMMMMIYDDGDEMIMMSDDDDDDDISDQ